MAVTSLRHLETSSSTRSMHSRRDFLQHGSAVLLGGVLSNCSKPARPEADRLLPSSEPWVMREEAERHVATWMAFPVRQAIWGEALSGVQDAVARIAKAIVAFEPVKMLVPPDQKMLAHQKVDPRVELVPAALDDLWIRDTGPIFVSGTQGKRAAIHFNFNGWGDRQEHEKDRTVAPFIAQYTQTTLLRSKLVLEGGGIEVDGYGTAIVTESSVLNPNRNPGVSKAAVEAELASLLGIRKVLWLPGIVGKDITDGHTDFYARFVRPGVVVAANDTDPHSYDHVVTQQHLEILRSSQDAAGRPLKVHTLDAPTAHRAAREEDFAAGYINYYLCNGAIIAPQFGDTRADAAAHAALQALYSGRVLVPVDIDPIARGGGGIHCATQQEPA